MNYKHPKLLFAAGIVGNILDHYDTALYVYMAPFLSQLFFPGHDPVISLIKTYAITTIGIVVRPLGALIFGRLALKYHSTNLLAITLCGVAICTFSIGLIPSYEYIGIMAPITLIVVRFVLGVFAAGEYTISSLFVLEQSNNNTYGKSSSYYICSTMAGIALASLAATIVSKSATPEFYWRIAFIIGLFTALFGLILRLIIIQKCAMETPELRTHIAIRTTDFLVNNKYKIFKVIILSSFSFLTFSLPFIFLNNFVPLITNIARSQLLEHNTILLLIDIILLPIAGMLVDKFNHIKWMICFALPLTISIVPIFYFLPNLSLIQVTLIKLWIIVPGVAFAVPLNVLLFKLLKGREKFLITGLGYALGTEILGRSTTTIGLSLWKLTSNTLAPAFFITFICTLTCLVLINELNRNNT